MSRGGPSASHVSEEQSEAVQARAQGPCGKARSRLYRQILFAAGIFFLILGAIGIVLPIMPGTVFLILAAWCFSRSSTRFENWLLSHPRLGPSVVRWRTTGAIPPFAKLLALVSFVVTLGIIWLMGAPAISITSMALLFAGLATFIVTRPNA